MKLIRPTLTLLIAGSALAFVSCDSKEEKRHDAALERKADALEDQATATKKEGERRAAAIKDSAEATKDAAKEDAKALEKAAEQTREQK